MKSTVKASFAMPTIDNSLPTRQHRLEKVKELRQTLIQSAKEKADKEPGKRVYWMKKARALETKNNFVMVA